MLEACLSVPEAFSSLNASVDMSFSYDDPTSLRLAKANGKNYCAHRHRWTAHQARQTLLRRDDAHQQMLNRANGAADVDRSVLIMDTPSVTIDGTFSCWLYTNSNPVGVFGNGMVTSARMWVGSQGQVIVGNQSNPTKFASIGVLMMLPNYENVMDAGLLPRMTSTAQTSATKKLQRY